MKHHNKNLSKIKTFLKSIISSFKGILLRYAYIIYQNVADLSRLMIFAPFCPALGV